MHLDINRILALYADGVITLEDCVSKFRDGFEVNYTGTELRTTAEKLPQDIFADLNADVDRAPNSTEEWARFRLIAGCVYWDPSATTSQIEHDLADWQAKYYRFVTAWRSAFGTHEQK